MSKKQPFIKEEHTEHRVSRIAALPPLPELFGNPTPQDVAIHAYQDTGTINIGILTSGGLAPCLSTSIACLIESYKSVLENRPFTVRLYYNGYAGLLQTSSSQQLKSEDKSLPEFLTKLKILGGTVIGTSRTKLTNPGDCVKKGLVTAGSNPLEIACFRLQFDKIHILHPIGGDDSTTQAALLSQRIKEGGNNLTVVAMPKTIDNDIIPLRMSLGCMTASYEGARFFDNIVNEGNTRYEIERNGKGSRSLLVFTSYSFTTSANTTTSRSLHPLHSL